MILADGKKNRNFRFIFYNYFIKLPEVTKNILIKKLFTIKL